MSESIIVTLQLSLKPEAVEPFCAQIPVTLEDTRKFPGFIAVTIRRHVDQPNRVIFVEEWQSQESEEALQTYNRYHDWFLAAS